MALKVQCLNEISVKLTLNPCGPILFHGLESWER